MNLMSTISELDRGLILYMQSSVGTVQVGGNSGTVKFSNLTGFLNSASITKFPQWSLSNSNNSTQLSDSYTSKWSNFLDYGLGSILLNFQDSLNTLNILI